MTKRAVLYARVARGDEFDSNHNLTNQLAACREYAISHGWAIVAELHEDERGASGLARDLPRLAQVRRMAQDGDFDVLVVRDPARISRDAALVPRRRAGATTSRRTNRLSFQRAGCQRDARDDRSPAGLGHRTLSGNECACRTE